MSPVNYKQAVSDVLRCKPANVFLYWKGRIALYSILKAMGIKEGDEVILPAFTCVVVPNAIIYLGAKPIYVDISLENYNTDIDKLKGAITSKTKVIICQNTFGLSSKIEQLVEIAKKNNLYTVEDCTHGFGGFYNGKPNGSYCDAAFYSTQWNKPFSTGIGGFLVVNNESLLDIIKALEAEKIKPSFSDQLILSTLLILNKYLINRLTYWPLMKFYRFLSKYNLIIGSNQRRELNSTRMPKKYFKDISTVQIKEGIKQLKQLNNINNLRRKNAEDYTEFLKKNMKRYVSEDLFSNHLFLKYPLIVKDRRTFLKLAEKNKIKLGDWFLSPIHPVENNFEQWGIILHNYPCAYNISQRIVNLPTEINENGQVIAFLSRNITLIE
jgi:dTDP-4-amino-4,6-dideoxygalactose transaminase